LVKRLKELKATDSDMSDSAGSSPSTRSNLTIMKLIFKQSDGQILKEQSFEDPFSDLSPEEMALTSAMFDGREVLKVEMEFKPNTVNGRNLHDFSDIDFSEVIETSTFTFK